MDTQTLEIRKEVELVKQQIVSLKHAIKELRESNASYLTDYLKRGVNLLFDYSGTFIKAGFESYPIQVIADELEKPTKKCAVEKLKKDIEKLENWIK